MNRDSMEKLNRLLCNRNLGTCLNLATAFRQFDHLIAPHGRFFQLVGSHYTIHDTSIRYWTLIE